jgi:outer membrane murein-binding lipoprotein Lpp
VLQNRTRRPAGRSTVKLASLLAVILLVAVPAAAEAKNFKVDGRVKGAPTAKGRTVSVPVQLTRAAGNKLRLGTRNVRVSIKRRARLRLSGSAAQGASRLAATGLRAGDRLKGITSLTRKARKRMRYTAVPKLKLKRGRVIRNARRLAPPSGPPPAAATPRTLEQALAELPGRVMALNAKVGEFGTLHQQIEAQRLQLEQLTTGLEGVTTAYEALMSALEARTGFEGVVATVEGQVLRLELIEGSTTAVEESLSQLESGIGTIGGTLEQLTLMAPLLASQGALIRSFPGAEAQIMALDETIRRIESRIGAAEAAIGNIGSNVGALSAQMATLASQVNAVAGIAASGDLGTVQAAVNGLAGGLANLEFAFAGLGSLGGAAAEVAALEADAVALEAMVEGLCTALPTACP